MIKDQELVGPHGELGVGLSFVVREFNFVGAIQEFNDGTHLTAEEAMLGTSERRATTSRRRGLV
jgi:hypothetical protein